MSTSIILTSFGYLHAEPPKFSNVIVDVRRHLRDPHVEPALIRLNGQDQLVIDRVMSTPGVLGLVNGLFVMIAALLPTAELTGKTLRVSIGCAGGRHRSVVLVDQLARLLTETNRPALAVHRDIGKLVVVR